MGERSHYDVPIGFSYAASKRLYSRKVKLSDYYGLYLEHPEM